MIPMPGRRLPSPSLRRCLRSPSLLRRGACCKAAALAVRSKYNPLSWAPTRARVLKKNDPVEILLYTSSSSNHSFFCESRRAAEKKSAPSKKSRTEDSKHRMHKIFKQYHEWGHQIITIKLERSFGENHHSKKNTMFKKTATVRWQA